jgi:AraC family transcriptional regulator
VANGTTGAAPAISHQQPVIRVDVVALAPFRVAVKRNEGPYSKLNEAYRGLFEWMAAHGALDSIGGIWGVPQQDRRDAPDESYEFSCCLAISSALNADDGVTLGDLGGGEYLRYLHEGSFDRLDESHDAMFRNLLGRSELELRDSPILHEYLNDPDDTPEADLRTHIYVPVQPV